MLEFNTRGRVIVFDGTDFSGKTTQIINLIEYLTRKRIQVFAISEQNIDTTKKYLDKSSKYLRDEIQQDLSYKAYLELTPKIRNVIISEFSKTPPLTIAMLFYSIRSFTTPWFKQLLDQGVWLILDRYVYSTYVYQFTAFTEKPMVLTELDTYFSVCDLINLTIILDLPKANYLERLQTNSKNILFDRWVDTYEEFSNKFANLKLVYPTHNIHVIKANGSKERVFEEIIAIINLQFFSN